MSYSSWSVSFAEQPSASKWNILGTNDAYFNSLLTGSGTIQSTVLTNPYKFSVYLGSAQSIGAGATSKVNFDTRAFDTGSNFDTTNKRFVAPISGFYQFNASVAMSVGSADTIATFFYKNGSQFGTGLVIVPSSATFTSALSISILVQLTATDYIEVFQVNGSGGSKALSTGATNSQFSGFLVSAT